MNTLRGPISNSVLLIAATILPLQQSPSATECCHGGHESVPQSTTLLQADCCAKIANNCCSSAGGPRRVCCPHGQAYSDSSNPDPCSGGCGDNDAPMAFDPATGIVPSDDELAVAVILTVADDATADIVSDSLRRTVSTSATSGSQRCVLLCRYRL